ncbi:MAG: dockerin type I domain-containing protein [Methanosarcinales archaeon]
MKGDFDGNGRVDIGDATYVAYMVVGKVLEELEADFNGNGRVDIGDAAKIAYYLVGKISEL